MFCVWSIWTICWIVFYFTLITKFSSMIFFVLLILNYNLSCLKFTTESLRFTCCRGLLHGKMKSIQIHSTVTNPTMGLLYSFASYVAMAYNVWIANSNLNLYSQMFFFCLFVCCFFFSFFFLFPCPYGNCKGTFISYQTSTITVSREFSIDSEKKKTKKHQSNQSNLGWHYYSDADILYKV